MTDRDATPSIPAGCMSARCATCGFHYYEHCGHIVPCPLCALTAATARAEEAEKANRQNLGTLLAYSTDISKLSDRVAALERETIERCAKVLDGMHEHITEGWDYYSDERADGTHNALTNGAKAIRALALRATEQQQHGKP